MAACIVCNQQIKPDDLQDGGDMAKLRSRLEKMLDEAVPQGSVICSSCQSDLAEIEMYYALLTVFKRRYSETAKQRSQLKESLNCDTRRNLLRDAAQCSSQDLQNIFGAGNSLQDSNTHLPLNSNITNNSKISPAVVKLDVLDVGEVKQEIPISETISAETSPSEHTAIEQGQSSNIEQAETIENSSDGHEATAWESDLDESEINSPKLQESQDVGSPSDIHAAGNLGQVVKRQGRPRKYPESIVFPIWTPCKAARIERRPDVVASPRKRGRPKMTEQPSATASAIPLEVAATGMKKRGRKNSTPNVTYQKSPATQKKRQRPKRDKSSASFNIGPMKNKPKRKGRPVNYEESESGESSLGEQNSDQSDAEDSSYDESDLEPLKPMKNRPKRKDRHVYYEASESGESFLGEQNTDQSDADDSSYDESDLEPLRQPSSSPGITTSSDRIEPVKEEVMEGEAADLTVADPEPMTSQDTIVDGGPPVTKRRGKPKEDEDPSYDPDAVIPVRRKKVRRPKNIDVGPFPCTLCEKVISTRHRLKVHTRSHSDVRPHMCSVCGKAFKTNSALKAHTKTHNGTKQFVCETCGRAFLAKADLEKHLFLHNDEYLYPCDQCDKRFKSPVYLKAHVKLHHVEGRKFLCSICGVASFTKHSLKTHMTTHNEGVKEKLWKCDTCGKYFATKKSCQIHEETHNPDTREKYLCPICGKSLLSKQYLKLHTKQHTGDTNISCSVCNATFTAPVHYRRHMTIHSGERPHKCTVCRKGFRLAANLKVHMMSHTDERPFRCSCGQAFRQKTKLRRHMHRKGHAEFEAKHVNSQSLNLALEKPGEVPSAVPMFPHLPIAPSMSVAQPLATASQFGLLPYGCFLPNENV